MNFEKFHYGSREVVVFVDEAGDRELRDPGNPVFVLGGCACWGRDIEHSIRQPWLDVRAAITGSREKPIHMRELSRRFGRRHVATMQKFFLNGDFRRVGFGVTDRTVFDVGGFPKAPVLEIALEQFLASIAELMSSDEPAEAISVVFEDGPLLPLIRKQWPNRALTRQQDGVGIPISWATLDKDAGEPALEVADYIAHSLAGYLRAERSRDSKFAERHDAIFAANPAIGKSLELNEARLVEADNA
ncbi:DUF3800 domain-containing protein [Caulobacter sp.]|uniref:DUF3800 domain-containing protein n=1 Tax=Caulobacter sp. TaxID=78 RepID=UPI003BB0015F